MNSEELESARINWLILVEFLAIESGWLNYWMLVFYQREETFVGRNERDE